MGEPSKQDDFKSFAEQRARNVSGMSEHPIYDALVIPPSALDKGGVEVLRAAIVDGGLHVTLRRAFDDPQAWGMLLADVTRHIARIYAGEGMGDEEMIIERVRSMYDAEIEAPTEEGSTDTIPRA